MSYSTLYAIHRTVATELREYRNGHGTGAAVWSYLCKRHLHVDSWFFAMGSDSRLWDLARDESVPLGVRACHAFTFDGAMIPRDKITEMADLIEQGGRLIAQAQPEHVNHFPAIAADLACLRLNQRALGVAINCTSVSDCWPREAKHWARQPWDCYAYIQGEEPRHD